MLTDRGAPGAPPPWETGSTAERCGTGGAPGAPGAPGGTGALGASISPKAAGELSEQPEATTRVVHCHGEQPGTTYDVYIGRENRRHGLLASPWANPFVIGKDGTRGEVIAKFETWLMGQPELLARLPELRGKRLGCWCAPQACHGDVLARLADTREPGEDDERSLAPRTRKRGTRISWTNETWNFMVGCSVVSAGCKHCYALGIAHRQKAPQYAGTTATTKGGTPHWTGRIGLAEHKLRDPLRVREPRRWFVNSMSDLFHENAPDEWTERGWEVMVKASWHTFQILTKRPERMAHWCATHAVPPHIWIGTSVEDQKRAEERLPILCAIEAPVRFVSAEPLLEPVNLAPWMTHLHWVIVGAESRGKRPGRPMDLDWVRSLRDQTKAAGAAFFFKQAFENGRKVELPMLDGRQWEEYPQ
jgi:protein gp37